MGLILGVIFVTPLVLTYLFFIRWVDRFEPEPWWLILAAFVWGALFATLGGGISSSIAQAFTGALFEVSPKEMDVLGQRMQFVRAAPTRARRTRSAGCARQSQKNGRSQYRTSAGPRSHGAGLQLPPGPHSASVWQT